MHGMHIFCMEKYKITYIEECYFPGVVFIIGKAFINKYLNENTTSNNTSSNKKIISKYVNEINSCPIIIKIIKY